MTRPVAEGVGTVPIKGKYRPVSWPRSNISVYATKHIWKEYSDWSLYYNTNHNSEEIIRAQHYTSWQVNKPTALHAHNGLLLNYKRNEVLIHIKTVRHIYC